MPTAWPPCASYMFRRNGPGPSPDSDTRAYHPEGRRPRRSAPVRPPARCSAPRRRTPDRPRAEKRLPFPASPPISQFLGPPAVVGAGTFRQRESLGRPIGLVDHTRISSASSLVYSLQVPLCATCHLRQAVEKVGFHSRFCMGRPPCCPDMKQEYAVLQAYLS